jgi:hypothetical protein
MQQTHNRDRERGKEVDEEEHRQKGATRACLTIPKHSFIEKPAQFTKSKVSTAIYPNKTSETARFLTIC